MKFKEKLRELRKDKDIKIRELAEKSSVSASYISMLENGLLANDPSPETIYKIEKGLGVVEGTLLSCSTSSSALTVKELLSDPNKGEKVRIIINAAKDDKKLEKMLKAIKE